MKFREEIKEILTDFFYKEDFRLRTKYSKKILSATKRYMLEQVKEMQSHIDGAIAHHESDLDYFEDTRKDVFKTKRELEAFLSAVYQFDEMLDDMKKKIEEDL